MLQDAHTKKENLAVTAIPGDNTVIAGTSDRWIYVHEITGDLDVGGTLTVKAGSRTLLTYALDAGQGVTLTDEPGEDNRPRFECRPGEDLVFNLTAGSTFKGNVHYSFRY